jgi:NADH-quinone oxidoreductase subunit N
MDLLGGQDAFSYLIQNSLVIRPQIVLVIWGIAILCVVPFLGKNSTRYPLFYTLAGLAVAAFYVIWGSDAGPAFGGAIVFDFFTRFFHLLFLVAAFLSVLLSYRYLEIEGSHHGEYYALILFATAGMMFMAGAMELITVVVGLELMSVSTYILVGFTSRQRRSNEASMKYFLLGAFSTGVILYGMSLLYGIVGSTNLSEIGEVLGANEVGPLVALAVILTIVGLCFKVAAVPFHMWAPDAYEGAPTSVTAFMSVAVKAAGFALFFRICLVAFGDIRDLYVGILALISMLTMTWGNVAAVTQTNIKRLLAYSSISHAGYILMGLVAGTAFGVRAAAIYLLIYTVANLGVWAVVIVLRREDIKGEDMDSLKGLFSQYPAVAILMLFFLLSLAGIPPMGGFIAKYFVFASVMDVGLNSSGNLAFLMFSVAIVGALNAVVALYYYLRIVVLMFFERDFVPVPLALSTGTTITLVVAGLLTLIMGIYPQPFIELAESAALPLM